jgi:hypothetical protein
MFLSFVSRRYLGWSKSPSAEFCALKIISKLFSPTYSLYFRRPNNFGRPHPWIANTQVPIGAFLILIEKFWLSIEPAICISAKKRNLLSSAVLFRQ